ncbi:zinc finger protein ZAT9-like [Mercurialis annua]|uniref:zinc finger protein ZAT9-like n=1 Tax=Mercurialis annua TaxID=3986 RepID=UPI00215FE617|nr:zinc finger protein ZAT9-like [Mercurialis annua]
MALIVEQQPNNYKHFCKICKKGFGCGRALGGHMRAHGIGDEGIQLDDDDPASDWEGNNNVPPSNKRMYALRTNPNRLKSCRICENCGKEFLSWKAFLEHGKCSCEDADSLISSPESDGDDDTTRRGCSNWSKRKRSLRAKVGYNNYNSSCPSSEEEDLANCLMMLSNATVDPFVAEPEESCASASKDEEQRRINPMNFMGATPLAYRPAPIGDKAKSAVASKGMFECKACKKVFNSHQALGGHRASHKKVKGCFAARLDQGLDDQTLADHDDDVITHEEFFPTKSASTFQFEHGSLNPPLASTSKRKSKVHECSICHRVFSSGQALGGHKRCHWITSNSPDAASSLAKFHQFQESPKFITNSEALDLSLDLNLPAPADHIKIQRDLPANPPSYEVSTEIYLKTWVGVEAKDKDSNEHQQHQNEDDNKDNINISNNVNNCSGSMQNVEDEVDSTVKFAKLSELKDMNMNGSSSPWLQVGIGSTTDVGAES